MNTLYYGDNLKILREYIKDESVDLVYLDPPFNSNRNYNVLFRNESGAEAESQITAFEDTWHWSPQAEETYHELINEADQVGRMIESLRQFIGTNQMMAYLVMMAVRLKELHRVLKPTGSLYLHCDPTASHYLKILLDTIFGPKRFLNEVSWKRSSAHSDTKQGMRRMGRIHDVVFLYAKGEQYTWNPVYTPYTQDYLESEYRHVGSDGRRYKETDLTAAKPGGDTEYEWRVKRLIGTKWEADLDDEYLTPKPTHEYLGVRPYHGRFWAYSKDNLVEFAKARKLIHRTTGAPRLVQFSDEMPGITLQDFWEDIPPESGGQYMGYQTQKPVALLERIIQASSNEGDVVLDPFCGCGTTIAAAQKLNREWIGIDVTHLAVGLMKLRLKDQFGMLPTGARVSSPSVSAGVQGGDETALTNVRATDTAAAAATYRVIGQPEDLEGAKELASKDRYGFQWWILPLIGAKAFGSEAGKKEGKMGADKGVDGMIVFTDDHSGKAKKVIVSVKSGHPNVTHIRDLGHVIDRDDAAIGVYLTLEPPTKPMLEEATGKGFYHSPGWNKDYPRIQILTVEELLAGKTVNRPPNLETFKQARRMLPEGDLQNPLFDEERHERLKPEF
jgi:DNA modification methylase